MNMLARAALPLLACLAVPAIAQVPDGLNVAAPANFVPSQALCLKGSDGKAFCPLAIPVTGTALAQGQVVTGDQAYTVGSTQPLNLTATGRLKVGVSSAGNVDPAAQLGTTIAADLVACKYRATTTWSTGWTGSISCDSGGRVIVSDPASSAYTFAPPGGTAESSNLAAFTFSSASQAATRGFYAICPSAGTVALTGANGGTVTGWPLTAGLQYHPFRIVSFASNSALCTIGVLF